jgi:hypothetical protein
LVRVLGLTASADSHTISANPMVGHLTGFRDLYVVH